METWLQSRYIYIYSDIYIYIICRHTVHCDASRGFVRLTMSLVTSGFEIRGEWCHSLVRDAPSHQWWSWLNEWVAVCFTDFCATSTDKPTKVGPFDCRCCFMSQSYHPGLLTFRCPIFNKNVNASRLVLPWNGYCVLSENQRQASSQPDCFDTVFLLSQQKASGKVLLDLVCSHMNLVEGDYFGLEYQNHQKIMVR